jgi:hypothetical protein
MARVYKKQVGLCRPDWTGGDGRVYRSYAVTYLSRGSNFDGVEGVKFVDVPVKPPRGPRLTEEQARAKAIRMAGRLR